MSYEVNLLVMDAKSRLQLLLGTARPFVAGKVRDTIRNKVAIRRARKLVPTSPSTSLGLNVGLRPLPNKEWLDHNREDVLAFARGLSKGAVNAYGVETWRIGESASEFIEKSPNVEMRGVLEVSRMHHWPAYALASLLQPDGGWAELLMKEIDTMRTLHRAGHGHYWAVAMDVGIRVHNMLLATDWLCQIDPGVADSEKGHAFERRVAAFAIDHAIMIDAMIETSGGMATSHLLGDLLGLISVGSYVKGDDEVVSRGKRATRRMGEEMNKQILDDGMSFEASTAYHRHVVDILVQAAAVLQG